MEEVTNQRAVPQPQPPMQSSSGIPRMVLIAGVVVLMALIGVGGYLLGTKSNQQQENNLRITPKNTQQANQTTPRVAIEQVTPSAKSTRKQYSNSVDNYSFFYPNDWVLKTENQQLDSVTKNSVFQSPNFTVAQPTRGGGFIPGALSGMQLEIKVSHNTNITSFQELKDFMENKSTAFPLNYFSSKQETTVDGLQAMVKTGGKPYSGVQDIAHLFKNGAAYKIILTSASNQDTFFNQLLSTLEIQ